VDTVNMEEVSVDWQKNGEPDKVVLFTSNDRNE
ncbi:MAG: hypothetical protein ABEH43_09895, partial [Flavobacteriales bacterium]